VSPSAKSGLLRYCSGKYTICAWSLIAILFSVTTVDLGFDMDAFAQPKGVISGQVGDQVRDLAPGDPIRREITGGQCQSFQIRLAAGQFLSALVTAGDAALDLELYDPQHRKIREISNRRTGWTPISFISTGAGVYTLKVKSLEGEGVSSRYALGIAQLRRVNGRDTIRVGAEIEVDQADRLRGQWQAEAFRQALEKYEGALKVIEKWNSGAENSYVLRSLGDIHAILGENLAASRYYESALKSIDGTQDPNGEIDLLNCLGRVNVDLGLKESALDYCQRAQTSSKHVTYLRGEAEAINNTGLCSSYLSGEKEHAVEFFDQALDLFRAAGDRQGQAQALSNLGHVNIDLGNVKKAISYLNQALTIWQEVGDRREEALTLTAMGLAHTSIGEMEIAIEQHNRAALLCRRIGDQVSTAVTLNGMAYVYNSLGDTDKALELYIEALRLYRLAGRRSGAATTLGLIGEIYESLGQKGKALDCQHKRLQITKEIGNLRAQAHTLTDIGTILESLGDGDGAMNDYAQALDISKTLHDLRGQAYELSNMGEVYVDLGSKAKAIDLYKQALTLFNTVEDQQGQTLSHYRIARATADLGDLNEAYDHCRAFVSIIESVRPHVANQDLRTSYFASVHRLYELYIEVLMGLHKQNPNAGYDISALEASEKARARSLLDLLNEARADIRQGVDPELLSQTRELQRTLNLKAERQVRLLSGSHTEQEAAAAQKETEEFTTQYEESLGKIRARSPAYAALTQARTLTLSEIRQEVLDPDSVLLEYSLGEKRSYLWVIGTRSFASVELPARSLIESRVERLYRSIISMTEADPDRTVSKKGFPREKIEMDYSESAVWLTRMLLDPVASQLKSKRLIFVADGALQLVPFVLLPESGTVESNQRSWEPLVATHEVVSLPSGSVLAALRREVSSRRPPSKTLAVLADPVFERDDPRVQAKRKGQGSGSNASVAGATRDSNADSRRLSVTSLGTVSDPKEQLSFHRLPFAWQEANAIAGSVPPDKRKLALGFDASLKTATSADLGEYRIVHIATHALIYGANPQIYGIVLSTVDQQGNPVDGFLRLNEIYNLKLPVDMVVLSACRTAIGKMVGGEGLVGLTRGFMYAGTPRVVASLWKVDDRATAEIMKYFYEAMLGPEKLTPAAALRTAQIRMMNNSRWRLPYYWAAFSLQGEWR
jgi:CHAT domain-containing protein/tetratricopeptide (TPR) repeat protein